MPEAISDTGPIRHLNEIHHLAVLKIFERLIVPELVADELQVQKLGIQVLSDAGLVVDVASVEKSLWTGLIKPRHTHSVTLQPADAQVLALAKLHHPTNITLTDDLLLRRHLEEAGITVTGTIGILVRAHKMDLLTRSDLEKAIDALFTQSSLHLSPAFRAYVRQLLMDL